MPTGATVIKFQFLLSQVLSQSIFNSMEDAHLQKLGILLNFHTVDIKLAALGNKEQETRDQLPRTPLKPFVARVTRRSAKF